MQQFFSYIKWSDNELCAYFVRNAGYVGTPVMVNSLIWFGFLQYKGMHNFFNDTEFTIIVQYVNKYIGKFCSMSSSVMVLKN